MEFSFLKQLQQPFPQRRGGAKAPVDSAITGLFVALFLYVLQPFDMSRSGLPASLHSLAYGVLTFLVSLAYHAFGEKVLKLQTDIDSWTLWKWICYVIGLITCIAIANFLYLNYSFDWRFFSVAGFTGALSNTFLVGIFPTIAFGLIIQLRATQANSQSASEIDASSAASKTGQDSTQTPSQPKILDFGTGPNDCLSVEASNIRYIEAMQNYISVCHVADGKVSRHLLRQTLSSAEQQCGDTSILRCHRSFLVNTDHIESASGNAQGLKLSLNNVDEAEVPVSRSYIASLKQIIAAEP